MNAFLTSLQRQTNTTLTENGAETNISSLDPVVDFYALAGAMRDKPGSAVDLFKAAFAMEPQTAVRTLFYLRDVRGGQGEREIFRQGLNWLRINWPHVYGAVVQHVPFYGRWDDVFHNGLTEDALKLVSGQLHADRISLEVTRAPVSLLGKWLPSANATAKDTRLRGKQFAHQLGLSQRAYRKTLSSLRSRIRLLEHDMSQKNWDGIDYSKLPSQAHRRHVKAFKRNTPERYEKYLGAVERGEAKINVKSVYPYEIYEMADGQPGYANVAWENLPDYTQGTNAIVMADVSGSMWGRPISVSVSLALYFAERNTGPFKGYFMTFSESPKLVKVVGSNLQQRLNSIQSRSDWGMNTDLLKAFRAILNAGRNNPSEMPKVLYVISDMEFDQATSTPQWQVVQQQRYNPFTGRQEITQHRVPVLRQSGSIFEVAKAEYQAEGLTLPHVVFWNVDARQQQAPALAHDGNVSLVSGLSPTTFAQAVEGKTPRELVDSVVNGPRYERIVL